MKTISKSIISILSIAIFIGIFLGLNHTAVAAEKGERVDVIIKFNNVPEGTLQIRQNFEIFYFRPLFLSSSPSVLNQIYRFQIKNPNLEQIKSFPSVEWVEIDQTVTLSAVNDEFYTHDETDRHKQWYLPKIGIASAWAINSSARNLTVAVIDTGIHASHQDLNDGRVVEGKKIFCETVENNQCQLRIREDILANTNSDDNGHGTSIASLIGAKTDNFLGIAGIAHQIKLMPVKVLNHQGFGTLSDVAEGITWAAENGADIINLSLGSINTSQSTIIADAIAHARSQGSIVIAAAGNDQTTVGVNLDLNPTSPVCDVGEDNNVLGVAATDLDDRRASFSNYGKKCIDIAAPGVSILVAHYDPDRPDFNNMYSYRNGTSFATAIVSGVTALLKSAYPHWSNDQVVERLLSNTDSIVDDNSCGNQTCVGKLGSGRLNAGLALGAGLGDQIALLDLKEGEILSSNGLKFIYQNNQKVRVLDWILEQHGLTQPARSLSWEDLSLLPGSKSLAPKDNTLIKTEDQPLVYVINNQTKRPLSFFSFTQNRFSFNQIQILPDDYLEKLENGNIMPPPENTLIKTETEPLVYAFQNEILRPLSLDAFLRLNYRFADIKIIEQNELDLYQLGEPILN